jgi:hypothetical protein
VDPAVLVADPTFEVLPASTETCGFGLDASVARQTRGDVLFGVHPSVVFSQPLLKWGDLWGFGWTCQMDPNGACATVLDFPFILGSQPVLKAETAKYVSLPFTTAGLLGIVPPMTSGAFKPSSSAGTPGTVIRMSISDRCGDFDPNGPFLSGHPKCMKDVRIEQTFLWTTAPSANVCSFRDAAGVVDPNKTWYVNLQVLECDYRAGDDLPAICRLNVLNQ